MPLVDSGDGSSESCLVVISQVVIDSKPYRVQIDSVAPQHRVPGDSLVIQDPKQISSDIRHPLSGLVLPLEPFIPVTGSFLPEPDSRHTKRRMRLNVAA